MLLSYFFPTGIVSSISFSPQNGMLAVGSYSQTTAVYAESNMEPLYVLHGQLGGVTQVSEATIVAYLLLYRWQITMLKISGAFFERWKLFIYWRAEGD
jgi:uncharacterized protein YaiE (UPF0345 family)